MKTRDLSLVWAPDLEGAIERNPLTVSPTTSLVEAIALISQSHPQTCVLANEFGASDSQGSPVRSSCALVVQGQELVGILTERDVVRLTAQAINFSEVTVADVMVHPVITLPQQSVQDIFAALFLFRRYRIRHLPIVNEQGKWVGVISHESIRQVLRPVNLLRFRRVSDVMTRQVIHAPPMTPVLQLARLMAGHRVSCVVITQRDSEENEQPIGIVTERDIVQCQSLQIDLAGTQAHTVMSTPLFLLSPEDSLWTAHHEMQKRRVGRLVVSWNWGKEVGIVTQTSLLRIFDPIEMYGVIETLQKTLQELLAHQRPPQSDLPFPLQVAPIPPADLLVPPVVETSPPASVGSDTADRDRLLNLLNDVHQIVRQVLDNPYLSQEQHQALLQSALEKLVQRHS